MNIDGRLVKAGSNANLKDDKKIIAEFNGKLGEIAQGVLGSDSFIITLDDLKR